MAYTNSKLVNYTKLSPNHSGQRNHVIDTVSIHCVVGQCSVETLGAIFADPNKEASSNYGIGYDGKIGMYVEEKNRSWCTSSATNDNRAITIEVASDTYEPYRVNAAAYKSLINLLVDICKRNGIKKLVWSTNKTDRINHKNGCNMTVHRDYANKSCPGDYLYNLHGQIAAEVNKQLGTTTTTTTSKTATTKTVNYTVKVPTALNIFAGAGTNYKVTGKCPVGVYTIVAESSGTGAKLFGKLLSGAGWIVLDHCTKVNTTAKKTIDEIAREVIQGKWGNGDERKRKLTAAGYDYDKVQAKVNELLK
ncbi:MAG: N-acetylmuramoyl-L-alanine amidase [Clostridia bacterium]|nr:N-acetylmuramoyl-L-alanine amidase [Clostridia bacterium]